MQLSEEAVRFIKGYDFLRLGQAISHHQWQSAAMTVRRMEQQAKKPGLEGFARPFAGIRQAVMRKDEREAKQILAVVTARRVKMLEGLKQTAAAPAEENRDHQNRDHEKKNPERKIRRASMDDLAAITAVEAACFPAAEAATEKDFAGRLAVYPEHFWLLEQDGRLIGFVNGMVTEERDLRDEMYENASLHREDGGWQMIFGVNTLPEYRRRGYAELVLRQVIADTKAAGRKGLVLTCKEQLLSYYGKLGFVNEGISDSVHGNVVWYQMRLTF